MKFSEIEFGKARGELEGLSFRKLLEHGYLDAGGTLSTLKSGDSTLILGRKGSGKSTVAEKLRIDLENANAKQKVAVIHLEDFPFKSFAKIIGGQAEPEARYPSTWSWILLLVIIDHLRLDKGARDAVNIDYNEAIQKLVDLGLLPTTDIKRLVMQSSKTAFKIQLFGAFEFSRESGSGEASSDLRFMTIVDSLKSLIADYSTEGGLTLVVDGLDDILSSREVQYKSLAALIFEADRLNLFFKSYHKPISIVVLCRTELFERLPGPNKNKLRQDSAIELDWYHDANEPRKSLLVSLANLRASLAASKDVDIFSEWFPRTVDGDDPARFLLDLTRHTPRDFIQLLNHLKRYYRDSLFTREQILSGARDYSVNYFLPEIRDELVGYAPSGAFERFSLIVGEIRQREFSYSNLSIHGTSHGLSETDLLQLLQALFGCSAIGHKWRTTNGSNRYEFTFRNRNAAFDKSKSIVLHKGLWKALNLI